MLLMVGVYERLRFFKTRLPGVNEWQDRRATSNIGPSYLFITRSRILLLIHFTLVMLITFCRSFGVKINP